MPPAFVIEINPTQRPYIDTYIKYIASDLISQYSLSLLQNDSHTKEEFEAAMLGVMNSCQTLINQPSNNSPVENKIFFEYFPNIPESTDTKEKLTVALNHLYKVMKLTDDSLSSGKQLSLGIDLNVAQNLQKNIDVNDDASIRKAIYEARAMIFTYDFLNNQIEKSPIYQNCCAQFSQKAKKNLQESRTAFDNALQNCLNKLDEYFNGNKQPEESIPKELLEDYKKLCDSIPKPQQGLLAAANRSRREISGQIDYYGILKKIEDIGDRIKEKNKDFCMESLLDDCYLHMWDIKKAQEITTNESKNKDSEPIDFSDVLCTPERRALLKEAEEVLNQLDVTIKKFGALHKEYNKYSMNATTPNQLDTTIKDVRDSTKAKPFEFIGLKNDDSTYSITQQEFNNSILPTTPAQFSTEAGMLGGALGITPAFMKALPKHPYLAATLPVAPYIAASICKINESIEKCLEKTGVMDTITRWINGNDWEKLRIVTNQHNQIFNELSGQIKKQADLQTISEAISFAVSSDCTSETKNVLNLVQKLIQYNQSSNEKPSLNADEKALAEKCKKDGCYFYHATTHLAIQLPTDIDQDLTHCSEEQRQLIQDLTGSIERVTAAQSELIYRAQLLEYQRNNTKTESNQKPSEIKNDNTQLQQSSRPYIDNTEQQRNLLQVQNER